MVVSACVEVEILRAGHLIILLSAILPGCGGQPQKADSKICFAQWQGETAALPHLEAFIQIKIFDQENASLNEVPMKLEKIVQFLRNPANQSVEIPLRISAKLCDAAKEFYLKMQKDKVCDVQDCKFARQWVFPQLGS
jgi:hypothetical protein